jgi:NADH dehydrogenase
MPSEGGELPLVVVVGGGFAGLEAAQRLHRSGRARVLLVDTQNFSLFTPMLAEVATGDIETRHILVPFRHVLPPSSYRQGIVREVNPSARTVVVETLLMKRRDTVHFDHLVLAPGGVTNFFGVPGAEVHTFTLKIIADAVHIRNRLLALLERASLELSAEGRARLCRVVVVGGGYSGVELAAGLADFFHAARRFYPELAPYLRVSLLEQGRVLVPMLPPRLQEFCRQRLERQGVEVRSGTRVAAVEEECVHLEGGETIPALTTIWTAGVKAAPLVMGWGLPRGAGDRIAVEPTLRVRGYPTVWAVGDAADVRLPGGEPAPGTAQHATREGRLVARNILAGLEGKELQPFRYESLGGLVSLGHRQGVGIVLGRMVSGFPAWWLWRTYYLFRLPTWLRRVRVALDWTIQLLFHRDLVHLPLLADRDGEGVDVVSGGGRPGPPPPGPAGQG